MSLVISNNMMAANTARILGNTYDSLAKSVQRLSSGLRINSAADDAAGLAIRELMRADIVAMQQGIRNAADGISLLQTAEGGMAVIDEKLVRMRELAEQAATGTYTTVQREIINSEYQAMAAEIDRIATATNFNGVKLLDGSMSSIHHGLGLKLHFGVGNDPAEDYYFVQIGDVRATTKTGLRVGGDAKNDIWGTVGTHGGQDTTGCCGGGIPSINEPVPGWKEGEIFSYGYNWDWKAQNSAVYDNGAPTLKTGRYIAGAWQADSTPTLQELLDMVNQGTQARVRLDFEYCPAKYTMHISSGYPDVDLTAYASALSTTCGIDKNYVVTGEIPVQMTTSAKPPQVCFAGSNWPPLSAFIYSITSGWLTAEGRYQVEFSGFNYDAISGKYSDNAAFYTYTDGSGSAITVYMSDPVAAGGTGIYWSATAVVSAGNPFGPGYDIGSWLYDMPTSDGSAVTILVDPKLKAEVEPEFAIDGQPVPRDIVVGDTANGFMLRFGTHVVKTQAHAITLVDLLGRTSAANSAFNAAGVLADNKGNSHYTLTSAGAGYMLMPGNSGSAITADLLEQFFTISPFTEIQELLDNGIIVMNSAYSASNIARLPDYLGNYPVFYDLLSSAEGAHRFCFEDEIYYIGSAGLGRESFIEAKTAAAVSLSAGVNSAGLFGRGSPFGSGRSWEDVWAISALAYAINNNPNSQFWARLETGGVGEYREGYTSLYVYCKEGGDKHNFKACDEQMGDIRGSAVQMNYVVWYNDEMEVSVSAGTYFNNGGKEWGNLRAVPTGYGSWGVQLHGRDVGKHRDLWILNVGEALNNDINTDPRKAFTGKGFGTYADGRGVTNLKGLDRQSFVEIQNADDGPWAGAHLRTQSDAQESLEAIKAAIERKDKVRATLGAYINRLENTITNLEIQCENLQASESRISDVDMATEMTTFVKNQVLTQAAVSMLSQANSLPQMALSLLNG